MTSPEEVLRNVEYVRCPDCFGARMFPSIIPGFLQRFCLRCQGWGCVADPAEAKERIELGLKALHPSVIIELAAKKKRLYFRLRLPFRKKRT